MKGESQGQPIDEFVRVRPKMYSYKMGHREKHTAKRITGVAAKELPHDQFTSQLTQPKENNVVNRPIGAKCIKSTR